VAADNPKKLILRGMKIFLPWGEGVPCGKTALRNEKILWLGKKFIQEQLTLPTMKKSLSQM